MPPVDLILRLLLAAGLGAAIGVERELRQKAAGLRTNMLIAVGSALFTIVSIELAKIGGDGLSASPRLRVSASGDEGGGADGRLLAKLTEHEGVAEGVGVSPIGVDDLPAPRVRGPLFPQIGRAHV